MIGHDSKIFSSSVYNHVDIGNNSTISGSIIDNDAEIGVSVNIENNTVIGPRTVLKNRTVVHSGTRIWPEVTTEEDETVKEYLLNEEFETSHTGS
jgi:mannose-1-phosphate guanylyltransferase